MRMNLQPCARRRGDHAERLLGSPVDVTDEPTLRKLAENLVKDVGVDALVNTVGAYAGGIPSALWQTEAKILEHMLDLNLRSGFFLSRVFIPIMLRSGARRDGKRLRAGCR